LGERPCRRELHRRRPSSRRRNPHDRRRRGTPECRLYPWFLENDRSRTMMIDEVPTDQQVQKAQTNLQHMIDFSTYLHANAADTQIDVAAGTLSLTDDADWGWALGLNVLESVFWALAGIEGAGPIGAFAAAFMSGVVSWFATSPPQDFT